MSDEKESSIRVIDRRRSASASGSSSSSGSSSVESGPALSKAAESSDPVKHSSYAEPSSQARFEPQQESYSDSDAEDPGSVDFPSFVVSFYTQALMMLGEIPHPETGLLSSNLPAARQTIDILVMIEAKTKGNLSPDEQRLLAEVIKNLQLAYVNKMKAPAVNRP